MKADQVTVVVDKELEDIVPGYLANRNKDVTQLGEALQQGDFELPRILGHRMKGSGSGYGFDEITRIGREIETGAKDHDEGAIRKALEELADYLERVDVTFE